MQSQDLLPILGNLVLSHSHGSALLLFEKYKPNLQENTDGELNQLVEALLLLSAGYTRAQIRHWCFSGQLTIPTAQQQQYRYGAIMSPLGLWRGIELTLGLGNQCQRLTEENDFQNLILASQVSVTTFYLMERTSKQQVIAGVPLRVTELAVVASALLPELDYQQFDLPVSPDEINQARQKGQSLINSLNLTR